MKNIRNCVANCDTKDFIKTLYAFLTNGKNGEESLWLEGYDYFGTSVLGRFICAKTTNNKYLSLFDSQTKTPIIIVSLGVRNHKHTLLTEFPEGNSLNSEENLYVFDIVLANAITLLNMCDCTVLEEHVVEGR
ncbi:MAG: hypothetical protein NTV03_01130 [Candidatus Nomurabacteria bacterium]|nr:hypothetical protein [Candidatus Nomurabacteria bacterium]